MLCRTLQLGSEKTVQALYTVQGLKAINGYNGDWLYVDSCSVSGIKVCEHVYHKRKYMVVTIDYVGRNQIV